MLIAGISERHGRSSAGIPAQWQRLAPYIGRVAHQIDNVTYGVVFDMLGEAGSFGYLAGVEVGSAGNLPPGFGHLAIPARRYAVFAHPGDVSNLAQTLAAIHRQWLPGSGCRLAQDGIDCFERYGPGFDPRSGRGDIEVWIPVETG